MVGVSCVSSSRRNNNRKRAASILLSSSSSVCLLVTAALLCLNGLVQHRCDGFSIVGPVTTQSTKAKTIGYFPRNDKPDSTIYYEQHPRHPRKRSRVLSKRSTGSNSPMQRYHRSSTTVMSASTLTATEKEQSTTLHTESTTKDIDLYTSTSVSILPARQPLSDFEANDENDKDSEPFTKNRFSLVSWNVLLPNSGNDNWWNHKMYGSHVDMNHRTWEYRKSLIAQRLLNTNADIICLQEASADATFEDDFDFLISAGYQYVLHKKYRFRCATFYNPSKFQLIREAHKDRTLITTFVQTSASTTATRTDEEGDLGLDEENDDTDNGTEKRERLLNVINCHLSGGAVPQKRLRQIHEALEQIRKWKSRAELDYNKQFNANRPNPHKTKAAQQIWDDERNAGTVVCGDFNSDGDTAVRRLLVDGCVDLDWYEPQYPETPLTSSSSSNKKKAKPKQHNIGTFIDAYELAYGSNVCDGDYGEACYYTMTQDGSYDYKCRQRPATYVVPNLASLLLLPMGDNDDGDISHGSGTKLRTQFGPQFAESLANTLGLQNFCEHEVSKAFEHIDLDGNNRIEPNEIQLLLDSVYSATHGRQPNDIERSKFVDIFWDGTPVGNENALVKHHDIPRTGLTRDELTQKLLALQEEVRSGSEGTELVEIRTEADAQRMVQRFTPLLQFALDEVFDKFSSDKNVLTEQEVEQFLVKTNGEVGRGGTFRHTEAIFERKRVPSTEPVVLTRQEWHGVFARELGEGKWWQVVYDLEVCGVPLRPELDSCGSSSMGRKAITPQHYQGWLDYVYFDSKKITCRAVQEPLMHEELSKVYDLGDALPNGWHPSDHLPVAAVFDWSKIE